MRMRNIQMLTLQGEWMNQMVNAFNKVMVAMSILFVASCSGGLSSDYSVDPLSYSIQINGKEGVEFDRARIKVKLFGTARNVADNAATLISESVLAIGQIPSTINLRWPENDYQLIDSPPVSAQEGAIYYLSITIDYNGDSVICTGDFVQNYDETPFTTINGMPLETIEFHVTATKNEYCQVF